jgi:hypothetical protein
VNLRESPVSATRFHLRSSHAALLGFSILATVVVWPGRMSNDTLTQVASVRSGDYSDWHAPLLIALWRPAFRLGVGPPWVVLLSTLTFVTGLYLVLRVRLSRRAATLAAMGICALPQVLGYLGYLGRDQWYTALLLMAFGGVALIHRSDTPVRVRLGWAVTLTSCWMMAAARQNGLPVAGVVLVAALLLSQPPAPDRRRGMKVVARAVGLALLGVIAIVISQAAARSLLGVSNDHPEQATQIYDVAAASIREGRVLFSPEVFPQQDLELLRSGFDPTVVNPLLFGDPPIIEFPVRDDAIDDLRADWIGVITTDPAGYLADRWRIFTLQLGIGAPSVWAYHPFIDQNQWGYEVEYEALDHGIRAYLDVFTNERNDGTWPHEGWPYVVAALFGAPLCLTRQRWSRLVGWMSVASLTYQATIFAGTMGIGFRLLYPSVLLALAGAVIVLYDVVAVRLGWQRDEGSLAMTPGVQSEVQSEAPEDTNTEEPRVRDVVEPAAFGQLETQQQAQSVL